MSLEGILVTIAGFVSGFVSTLASNGSSVTLPALEFLGLPEHGTVHFYREGLVDLREPGSPSS